MKGPVQAQARPFVAWCSSESATPVVPEVVDTIPVLYSPAPTTRQRRLPGTRLSARTASPLQPQAPAFPATPMDHLDGA